VAIKGATFDTATDSLEAIRNRGDAAWITATSVTVSDKTGFSLAADQSAVTIGTVTTLTNLPAITANWLTAAGIAADAVTELQAGLATSAELAKVPKSDSTVTWNATALASIQSEANDALVAFTGDTGITLAKALEMLAAFMAGKVEAVSAGGVTTYSYKARNGTTTSFTAACSETDGTRATTGSLS
jgi:hypothetical protein